MLDASTPSRGALHPQRVWAEIDGAAITQNVGRLREAAPGALCCAVVKADGYGHGAVTAARAALAGGAEWLAVATAAEATELRKAGLTARILVLGPLTPQELDETLAADADLVAWTHEVLDAAAARGGARVHVKLDTGMGRLGTRDADLALALLQRCVDDPALEPAGVMTHFATADELGDLFFAEQREAFLAFVARAKELAPEVIAHAANSAAVLRDPATHLDMIRPGVAVYGLDPFGSDPHARQLTPAMALRSTLGAVKPVAAGQSTGYGRRWVADEDGYLGIIPVGYADGWRRGLATAADALIDGVRYPLVGTVSMDSVAVHLGAAPARVGSIVTLLGRQGEQEILAEELARTLGTINYEIVCGLGPRVPRR